MSNRDTARRLQALEARADREAKGLYEALVWALSDDELDAYIEFIGGISEELQAMTDDELARYAAEEKVTYEDYTRLAVWLEDRRAQIA